MISQWLETVLNLSCHMAKFVINLHTKRVNVTITSLKVKSRCGTEIVYETVLMLKAHL